MRCCFGGMAIPSQQQIRTNTSPAELSLRMAPVAVRAIAKAMGDNSTVLSLDVSRSGLKDDVGSEFALSLKRNSTLCRLDLEYNQLGPASAASLGGDLLLSLLLLLLLLLL